MMMVGLIFRLLNFSSFVETLFLVYKIFPKAGLTLEGFVLEK